MLTIASVYAGSRNSYRGSPCGLLPLLVNGKSGISTVFFVFLWVFMGFEPFYTTFAPVLTASGDPGALKRAAAAASPQA
jgi:hypothetical protein